MPGRRLKPSDNSPRSTRPAAHPAAVSPSIGLLERLDSTHTPHPRHSNPHSPRRDIHVPPPAVSSLGGLRTPAPVCAAPPSWGRHPQTFTTADIQWVGLSRLFAGHFTCSMSGIFQLLSKTAFSGP